MLISFDLLSFKSNNMLTLKSVTPIFFSGTVMVMMLLKHLQENFPLFHQCGFKSNEGKLACIPTSHNFSTLDKYIFIIIK